MTDEEQNIVPEETAVETPVEETPTDVPIEETPTASEDAIPDSDEIATMEGTEVAKAEINRHVKPGMIVRVHETITDFTPAGAERRRTQVFEGMVLGLSGSGNGRTMTIRRVHKGFGVEKIYPLASPNIEKVEIMRTFRARRAKLTFLRGVFKRGRIMERFRRKLKEIKDDDKK